LLVTKLNAVTPFVLLLFAKLVIVLNPFKLAAVLIHAQRMMLLAANPMYVAITPAALYKSTRLHPHNAVGGLAARMNAATKWT
jgi:hypothetical protein